MALVSSDVACFESIRFTSDYLYKSALVIVELSLALYVFIKLSLPHRGHLPSESSLSSDIFKQLKHKYLLIPMPPYRFITNPPILRNQPRHLSSVLRVDSPAPLPTVLARNTGPCTNT